MMNQTLNAEQIAEFVTIESAIAELVEVLEHTPPEDRPEPRDVLLAVAEGYGEGVDLSIALDRGQEI